MASETADAPRASVFISYSRKDCSFVNALQSSLVERGFNAYLDRTDIAPGEDWEGRLEGLIRLADVVVFVVTDHSLQSAHCAWEVDRATALGKRLLPLVHGPQSLTPPSVLAARNYTFSDAPLSGITAPEKPTAAAIDLLSGAIEVDIGWVREHTRLSARAAEWARVGAEEREQLLLRMGEVERARSWIAMRPNESAPTISKTLADYIDRSEARELADQDFQLTLTGRGFVPTAREKIRMGDFDGALRACAAGSLLAKDLTNSRVPELGSSVVNAAASQAVRAITNVHAAPLARMCVSAAGDAMATIGHDGVLQICEGPELEKIHRLSFGGYPMDLCALDWRQSYAVAAQDADLMIWRRVGEAWSDSYTLEQDAAEARRGFRTVASCREADRIIATSMQGFVYVWDLETRALISRTLPAATGATILDALPGGLFVTAAQEPSLRLWDATTGVQLADVPCGSGATRHAQLSARDQTLIYSGGARSGVIFRTSRSSEGCAFDSESEGDGVTALAISADGVYALSGHDSGIVRLWNIQTLALEKTWRHLQGPVRTLDVCNDCKRCVAGSDHDFAVWNYDSGEVVKTFSVSTPQVAFSGDGALVWAITDHYAVKCFDVAGGDRIATLSPGDGGNLSGAILGISGAVYTVADNARVTRWNPATESSHSYPEWDRPLARLTLSHDGEALLAWSDDMGASAEVPIFHAHGDGVRCVLSGHSAEVICAGFLLADTVAATVTEDGLAWLWDAKSGQKRHKFRVADSEVMLRAMIASGSDLIVALPVDGELSIWRLDGSLVSRRPGAWPADIDHSGERLFCAQSSKCVSIVNLRDGSTITETARLASSPSCGTFSTCGNWLAIGTRDAALIIDALTGQELARCQVQSEVCSLDFDPVAQRLLLLTVDGVMGIWDWRQQRCVWEVQVGGHTYAKRARFGADGTLAFSWSHGDVAQLYDVRWTAGLVGSTAELNVAALLRGRGLRSAAEAEDVLMQSAPADSVQALLDALGADSTQRARISERAALLAARRHPNCYLRPGAIAGQLGKKDKFDTLSAKRADAPGAAENAGSKMSSKIPMLVVAITMFAFGCAVGLSMAWVIGNYVVRAF